MAIYLLFVHILSINCSANFGNCYIYVLFKKAVNKNFQIIYNFYATEFDHFNNLSVINEIAGNDY